MSFYLDTNFVYSILFADAHTPRAFSWLGTRANGLVVGDWTATELFALVHRRVRSGTTTEAAAQTGLADFDAFVAGKTQRLPLSAPAGALSIQLARHGSLKLSAADALHLACAADGGHVLVTFDQRLADAARLRGYPIETP